MTQIKTKNCTGLIGGALRDLDYESVTTLTNGDRAIYYEPTTGGAARFFDYDATSTATTDVSATPARVRPADYVSAGCWIEKLITTIDDPSVSTIANLRLQLGVEGETVQVLGYYAIGDGGGGPLRYWVEGAAPGTYVDNGGSIIVPTVGDGSAAWLFNSNNSVDVSTFGAKGDGTTDDYQSILKACIFAKDKRESEGITTTYVYFPEERYSISSGIPLVKGVGLRGNSHQGTNLVMTGNGSAIYSATYSAGVFTDNLNATLNDIQTGAKDVSNTALFNIHVEHVGTLSGNAPSGAAWQGAIDIVGAPAIVIDGTRASIETNNADGIYLKYSWKCRVSNYQTSRGGYTGGYGLYLDSNCNNAYIDHPDVYGAWESGIRSTNPDSVTIIEPNVEFADIGIWAGGRSPRIVGGYFEGNKTDIRLGTIGGTAATDWLIDCPFLNGSVQSQYSIDLANASKGRCLRPGFLGTYTASRFRPRTIADGNIGNTIEITASDASNPDLPTLGLNTGRNIIKVFGIDYDDNRFYQEYKSSDQSPLEINNLNVWGNVFNSMLIRIFNDGGTIKGNYYNLDESGAPQFDDMFVTRPAALTAIPTVDGSTGFGSSSFGLLSGSKYVLILNASEQTLPEASGVASISFSTESTQYLARLSIGNRNVNGSTILRPEILLTNATTGANVDWDSISSGGNIRVNLMGFFKPSA